MTKLLQKRDSSKETLQKKQWSKYVSKGIALSLMHYNPKSELFKSYRNSTFCNEILETNEVGKITTSYCKNRWCGICNRIKTARLINEYLPQLEELFQPVFVTVTLPTCIGEELPNRIREMEKNWRAIYHKTAQVKYRKTNNIFKGIRKAECTIRPNGLYHYHFHFILNDWAQGEWLVAQWLQHFPQADRKAQDIRFANEFAFRELFKYAFKAEVKTSNKTNAKRYDLVFNALRNKRTYQAFGGIKAVKEDFDEDDLTNGIVLEGMYNSIFKWCMDDWYEKSTGLALVGKSIPEKVKNMVDYPKE
jgi:hypothetical protein